MSVNRRTILGLGGAAAAGGALAGLAGARPAAAASGTGDPFWDVKMDFGAVGDGKTDDRAAIQSALQASQAAGGGVVYLPPGAYLLASPQQQAGVRFYLLDIPSRVTVRGAGRDVSVLRAGPGMPDQTRILSSASTDGASVVDSVAFEDFTVDGDAAGQANAGSMAGISMVHTQRAEHLRVRVIDVKGTSSAEGACFDSFFSFGNQYVACEALRTPGSSASTGSGFSSTSTTGTSYIGCKAMNSAHWQGFTHASARHITHVNCLSYLNAQRGFNSEGSWDIGYANCHAGLMTENADQSNSGPYPPGTVLGNGGDGFYFFHGGRISADGCFAGYSANTNGFTNVGSTDVRITNGIAVDNNSGGYAFSTAADAQNSVLVSSSAAGNRAADMVIAGTAYPITGAVAAPPQPASGEGVVNPYPFDVTVYIFGGTVNGVSVAGQNIWGLSSGPVRLRAGATLQIYYTAFPHWTWLAG